MSSISEPTASDDGRSACERLVHRYCTAYDQRDADAVLDLVTVDVRFELAGGEVIADADDLRRHVSEPTEDGVLTHHHVTTFDFERTGEAAAVGQVYLLIPYLRRSEGQPRSGFLSRRYADDYRLVDDRWQIAHRRYIDQIIH